MSKKTILTDADGVLLSWIDTFREWASVRGYSEIREDVYDLHLCYDITKKESQKLIKLFNESAAICQLDPFRDAEFWVKRIHEEFGYKFRVITSMSLCPYAIKARDINLKNIFGSAIESVTHLDTAARKMEALSQYKNSGLFWVEDKLENAIDGLELGLKSIIMEHNHNLDACSDSRLIRVSKWKQIYNLLKRNEDVN